MKKTRTVVYDEELQIEAYRFEGIVKPFPNHFHDHYVIGFVEDGKRVMSCRNKDYNIEQGNVVLFRAVFISVFIRISLKVIGFT